MCDTGVCSTGGLCFSTAATDVLSALNLLPSTLAQQTADAADACAASPESQNVCLYTPDPDIAPPVLTALGQPPSHVRAYGGQPGQVVVESYVQVADVYSDAGAVALDSRDGDVSDSVSASGLAWVTTSVPTLPQNPFVIHYSAQDSSGNTAEPVLRYVHVTCPEESLLCTFADGGAYCSLSDVACIEPVSPTAVLVEPVAPVLSLVGPQEVEVLQGTPYGACSVDVPVATPCDRGATAHSDVEGDVSWSVAACADGFLFWEYGLAGCSIDTSVVGSRQLAFFVVHGERRIEVHRTLWVLEVCIGMLLYCCLCLIRA